MTKLDTNITLSLTEQEALYLKSLVGKVTPSDLPHGKFATDLYYKLHDKFPETPTVSPWKHHERGNGLVAVDVDWSELV